MKKLFASLSLFSLPVLALAAVDLGAKSTNFDTGGLGGLITALNRIINYVVPFLVGLAVLFVIYGIFSFISSAGDEEARATAKQFIIWGIIGVFLMLSVWGLVTILAQSFNLATSSSDVTIPTAVTQPVIQ